MSNPIFEQARDIFAIPSEVKYPEIPGDPDSPHATAHHFTPELFGYDIVPGKSRIALPYFERFLEYRE